MGATEESGGREDEEVDAKRDVEGGNKDVAGEEVEDEDEITEGRVNAGCVVVDGEETECGDKEDENFLVEITGREWKEEGSDWEGGGRGEISRKRGVEIMVLEEVAGFWEMMGAGEGVLIRAGAGAGIGACTIRLAIKGLVMRSLDR